MKPRVRDARILLSSKQNARSDFHSNNANSFKRNLSVNDARNHIVKGSLAKIPSLLDFDARQQIIRPHGKLQISTQIETSRAPIKKNTVSLQDCIKTKKTIKNEHAKPISIARDSTNFKSLSNPVGFVCVTGDGQRTVQNKVTIGNSGLKIAVRNDSMKTKPKAAKLKRANLSLKKTIPGMVRPQSYSPATRKSRNNNHSNIRVNNAQNRNKKQNFSHKQSSSPSASGLPVGSLETKRRSRRKPYDKPSSSKSEYLNKEPQISHNEPQVSKPNTSKYAPVQNVESQHSRLSPSVKYISPFQGTKVTIQNLHPRVVEEDIQELFSVVGPVKRARLGLYGDAEVVFVRKDDAVQAIRRYNNRDLDGQPMKLTLKEPQGKDPHAGTWYSWMSDIGTTHKLAGADSIDLNFDVLQRALFRSGSTSSSTRPVMFTVKV